MKAPVICRTLCANTTDLGSSAGNKYRQTTHAKTSHKIVNNIHLWKKKDYMHTPNSVLNHTCISICVYCCFKLLFTFTFTETEEVCCVREGNVCAEDYTLLWKNTLYIKDRIFYTSEYSVGR